MEYDAITTTALISLTRPRRWRPPRRREAVVPHRGMPVPLRRALALIDPHARLAPDLAPVPGAGLAVEGAQAQQAVAAGAVFGHRLPRVYPCFLA
jgi:hypothetical protein